MADTDTFERAWERMQAGEPVHAAAEGAGAGDDLERYLERYLATAGALASFSKSIEVPRVEQSWASLRPMLAVPGSADVLMFVPKRSPLMGLKRAAVLVAAMLSMSSLGAVVWAVGPGSPLYPARLAMEEVAVVAAPNDAGLRRDFASRRLTDLLSVLHSGAMSDEASAMATSLMDARAEAAAAGASTASLDAAIRGEVPDALSGAPSDVSVAVRTALDDVLPPSEDGSGSAVDYSACAKLKGLENAICRHEMRLELNPANTGLQNSLEHLQANLAKQHDKTPPGQDNTNGQDKTPPGQDKTPPGQDKTPPGQDKTPPGQDKTPPGQDNTNGQDKTPPGQDKTPPGQSKAADEPIGSDK